MAAAPVATRVRSTMLIVSREGLKARGYFDEYNKHLDAATRAQLEQTVAGVWLPFAIAEAHYLACDALKLSLTEQRDLGGISLRSQRETLMGTMAKSVASAGIVNLWDVLARYNVFYARFFSGGGPRVWKVGPKEALLEICGLPIARIPYLRNAYGGLLNEGARFFHPSSFVAEMPRLRTAESFGFRISWV
jgi:hypothetical protein